MKIINLFILLALSLISASGFANCPPPDNSWITETSGSGVPYSINPPAGWTFYVPGGVPTANGQVSFLGATIYASPSSDPDPYKNLSVVTTVCKYTVNDGAGGKFAIENLASYTTDLTKNPWVKINPGQFDCLSKTADITLCAFKGP